MKTKKDSFFLIVLFFSLEFLLSTLFISSVWAEEDLTLIAWWDFEKTENGTATDKISGVEDTISGNYRNVEGSSGDGLKFDGYTTAITRKASLSPRLTDAFTVEAWIAIAAYPWNWCLWPDRGISRLI